jgi:hypothetical protein
LSRQAVTSHTDSTLGGGALACTATAQANLGAGAPLGATATVVEDRPNRATTVGLLWTVSAAVGEQNGDPCHLDHVGGNLIAFGAPYAELGALSATGHGASPVLYSTDAVG